MKSLLMVSSTIAIAGLLTAVLGAMTSGPHGDVFGYGACAFFLGGCGVGYSMLSLDERKRGSPPRVK